MDGGEAVPGNEVNHVLRTHARQHGVIDTDVPGNMGRITRPCRTMGRITLAIGRITLASTLATTLASTLASTLVYPLPMVAITTGRATAHGCNKKRKLRREDC